MANDMPGSAITSGSPLGPKENMFASPNTLSPQAPEGGTPNVESMMEDPAFQGMIMAAANQKKKKTLKDLLEGGGGSVQELAQAFPKLEQIMEQKKLADAQKKVADIKLEQLYAKSQKAYEAQQAQQQQQGVA
jgi:hypothetical protein